MKTTFGLEAIEAEIDVKHKRKALEELIERLLGDTNGPNTRSESQGLCQKEDES